MVDKDERSCSHIGAPTLIKKYIRGFGHNFRLIGSTHIRVVKVKPFFVIGIPRKCRVVPTTE